MRAERRQSVGNALRIPRRDHGRLDCVESSDVSIVLKPSGALTRAQFSEPELRPLLRQAIVAISAAVESYIAEKAHSYAGDGLDEPTERLRGLAIAALSKRRRQFA